MCHHRLGNLQMCDARTESLTSIATVTKELSEQSAASLPRSSSLVTFQFVASAVLLSVVISNACLSCGALCHRRSLLEKRVVVVVIAACGALYCTLQAFTRMMGFFPL